MQSLDLSTIVILGTAGNREGHRILGGILFHEEEGILSFLDVDGVAHLVPRHEITSTITQEPDGSFSATVFESGV